MQILGPELWPAIELETQKYSSLCEGCGEGGTSLWVNLITFKFEDHWYGDQGTNNKIGQNRESSAGVTRVGGNCADGHESYLFHVA